MVYVCVWGGCRLFLFHCHCLGISRLVHFFFLFFLYCSVITHPVSTESKITMSPSSRSNTLNHYAIFLERYHDRQASDEGRRAQRWKRCDNKNKDTENSLSANNILKLFFLFTELYSKAYCMHSSKNFISSYTK